MSDDPKQGPLELHQLGWQWFQLHAQQRMQLVGFWFVAMSFLTTAAVVAYVNARLGASLLVQLGIAGASAVFLLLDLRTRELIGYGEQLMMAMEKRVADSTGFSELALVECPHRAQRRLPSYRVLISALYGGATVISLTTAALTVARV